MSFSHIVVVPNEVVLGGHSRFHVIKSVFILCCLFVIVVVFISVIYTLSLLWDYIILYWWFYHLSDFWSFSYSFRFPKWFFTSLITVIFKLLFLRCCRFYFLVSFIIIMSFSGCCLSSNIAFSCRYCHFLSWYNFVSWQLLNFIADLSSWVYSSFHLHVLSHFHVVCNIIVVFHVCLFTSSFSMCIYVISYWGRCEAR